MQGAAPSAPIAPPGEGPDAAGRYRWYALGLMIIAYACHSVDRQVLSVILEPVKAEFGMSDRAMGLLGGLAYSAAFAAACLPLGWLIDRTNRRKLLAILLTIWSGLTLLCGFASSFVALLLMRMGVGMAEAGGQPACLSLICDYFGPRQRSTAIGYFYLSIAIGIAASFLIGGMVAAQWGWRAAFFVAGFPGVAIAAIIFFTLREPRRGQIESSAAEAVPLHVAMRHVLVTPPLLHATVAMTLASMTTNALWLWVASLLIRVHGMAIGRAGLIVAAAACCSAIGSAVAGRIADVRARRDIAATAQVPMVTSVLFCASGVALALTPSLPLAGTCLMVSGLMAGAYLGPSYAMAMTLVPAGMRGATASGLQLSINLIGTGLGPLITGALSDFFGGGAGGLSTALALMMTINLWAAWHYWRASRKASVG